MPIKLDSREAKDVDFNLPEYREMLDNLQANILKSHGRDFARHLFVHFTATRDEVRRWIKGFVAPKVTTAAQQLDQARAKRGGVSPNGGTVWGFFLSASGYEHLGLDKNRFASDPFRKGMKHQDDPPLGGLIGGNNKDPRPSAWETGFQGDIHALIAVADDDEDAARQAAEEIRSGLDAGVGRVVNVEEGVVLRRRNKAGDVEPVEHFGYFDGISNPLFTKEDLERERQENMGRKDWDPSARLSLVLTDDPFTDAADAFGSYLVYRKLGQDVRAFEERVEALAKALGISADLAGAMVVGRFKDGTPVLAASAPSPGPEVLNDFNYRQDEDGVRCPLHAHIRKANPRGTTPFTSLERERRRRIARRGIPYGKPLREDIANNLAADPNPAAPRGLLFMCFQQDIEDHFEFIQRTWIDNKNFPRGILFQKNTGDDPLIGQDREEAQRWPEKWGDGEEGKKTFNFEAAVTLKGGEYFFAPSLPFLRSL